MRCARPRLASGPGAAASRWCAVARDAPVVPVALEVRLVVVGVDVLFGVGSTVVQMVDMVVVRHGLVPVDGKVLVGHGVVMLCSR